jgi:LAO/AO transport system kinase
MTRFVPSLDLVERARRGETLAIGRLISRAEAARSEVRPALAEIYAGAGHAHVVGITGVPGSGKSTLVAALTARLRAGGTKVGIVAIDPSSPNSGGAILGDRIRMSELAGDPGVYIRSMATHGATGGLARATLDAVDILDVAGFGTIIIETVGVGQDEVEIARASHTTIVVSAPGLGDDIQAIKAGTLEIADIHVVSKCDRADAAATLADIGHMLTLGAQGAGNPDWQVPVLAVSALAGDGLAELVDAISRHRGVAFGTGTGRLRQLAIARFRLEKTADTLLLERFKASTQALLPAMSQRLLHREHSPYHLAQELLAAAFPLVPGGD